MFQEAGAWQFAATRALGDASPWEGEEGVRQSPEDWEVQGGYRSPRGYRCGPWNRMRTERIAGLCVQTPGGNGQVVQ